MIMLKSLSASFFSAFLLLIFAKLTAPILCVLSPSLSCARLLALGEMWSFAMSFQGLMRLYSSIKLMETLFLTSLFMDVRDGSQKLSDWNAKIARFATELLWHFLHVMLRIWYLGLNMAHVVESYLISHGWLKKYKSVEVSKLRYLAIVVESEDARRISEVIELLDWVAAIGVRHVCLYDMEGVLKESKETILAKCNARPWKGVETAEAHTKPCQLTLEFASASDGKLGVTKAANLLFVKHKGDQDKQQRFTEPLLDEALRLVGCFGPDPDLMLVYGPTRCHLGFPAWRIRYTEIVHMGCLKSKQYGSLIKAIYRFTTVRQNYGT